MIVSVPISHLCVTPRDIHRDILAVCQVGGETSRLGCQLSPSWTLLLWVALSMERTERDQNETIIKL